MSAGFTSGPWEMRGPRSAGVFIVKGNDGCKAVCQTPTSAKADTAEENRANAHLIAAAPELYDACLAAKQFIENGVALGFIRMPDPDTPDKAHDTLPAIITALAKARGEA